MGIGKFWLKLNEFENEKESCPSLLAGSRNECDECDNSNNTSSNPMEEGSETAQTRMDQSQCIPPHRGDGSRTWRSL